MVAEEPESPLTGPWRAVLDGAPDALLDRAVIEDWAGMAAGADVIREFLPLSSASQSGGERTLGAVLIARDAVSIVERLDRARMDAVLTTLSAAAVVALLLFFIFRAAQGRITRQTEALIESARRDPVTELFNHGTVVEVLAGALEGARGSRGVVAVALLDVDNFTLVNEVHGHDAGDELLRRMAALAEYVDESWMVGRFGPDEFLVVAPEASVSRLEGVLAAFRRRLKETSVQFGESEELPITFSAGIAACPEQAENATELISSATMTLTEAKSSGGDMIRVADRTADERADARGFDVLQGLVIAVDNKDRYTKRHSEDVARYATFIARRLGLDEEFQSTIRLAGLLHDVGKIGIPDAILRKPGQLTENEADVVKQHVALGDAIVRDLPNVELVRCRDPTSSRAVGWPRLSPRARGGGDPPDRADSLGGRRVQRHDHHPPIPEGALADRGAQAARGCRWHPAGRAAGDDLRQRDRNGGRCAPARAGRPGRAALGPAATRHSSAGMSRSIRVGRPDPPRAQATAARLRAGGERLAALALLVGMLVPGFRLRRHPQLVADANAGDQSPAARRHRSQVTATNIGRRRRRRGRRLRRHRHPRIGVHGHECHVDSVSDGDNWSASFSGDGTWWYARSSPNSGGGNRLHAFESVAATITFIDTGSDGTFTWTGNAYNKEDCTDDFAMPRTVSVTVDGAVADNPPVAQPDAYATGRNAPLTAGAPGVLANDTDPDGDPLTATQTSGPTNGSLAWGGDGSFTYTPDPGFVGSDALHVPRRCRRRVLRRRERDDHGHEQRAGGRRRRVLHRMVAAPHRLRAGDPR